MLQGTSRSRYRVRGANARNGVVIFLVLGLLAGQATAVATQREIWPFSPFRMYSRQLTEARVSAIWMYGVVADSVDSEVPLSSTYFSPLTNLDVRSHIRRVGTTIEQAPAGDPAPLHARLRALYDRYESGRGHQHDGPALRAIRLYKVHWTLDPSIRKAEPDRRDLIIEVPTSGSRRP